MVDELVEFVWDVAEAGYRWIEACPAEPDSGQQTVRPGWFLTVNRAGLREKPMAQRYAPLRRYTGLFRTFADIQLTCEGVQAFANTYGLLGSDRVSRMIVLPEGTPTPGVVSTGESLRAWEREWRSMRRAVQLWEAAHNGDVASLSRVINWKGRDAVQYNAQPDEADPTQTRKWEVIASAHINPGVLAHFQPGDVIRPALYYVQRTVNESVKGIISPRLLWKDDMTGLGWHVVPDSLLGALWLQLAQAISGKKEYRRCLSCDRWYELEPATARQSKLYCSDACRMRAYRRRRASQLVGAEEQSR